MARPVHGARARPRTATGVSAGSSGLPPRHGVARVLSKLGVCSRSEATRWVQAGRVGVDGRIVRDPEFPVIQGRHRISVDGHPVGAGERLYLMLNKPRGLLTTASDEHDRDTVYRCFEGAGSPWLGPVDAWTRPVKGCCCSPMTPDGPRRSPIPDAARTRPITSRSTAFPMLHFWRA